MFDDKSRRIAVAVKPPPDSVARMAMVSPSAKVTVSFVTKLVNAPPFLEYSMTPDGGGVTLSKRITPLLPAGTVHVRVALVTVEAPRDVALSEPESDIGAYPLEAAMMNISLRRRSQPIRSQR